MVQLDSTTIYLPLFRKISDCFVNHHHLSVHNLCFVGRGVLCVVNVGVEHPAAPLGGVLDLEVSLRALAFGTLYLVCACFTGIWNW